MADESAPDSSLGPTTEPPTEIGGSERARVARQSLQRIDERRAVYRAQREGLDTHATAARLGTTPEHVEQLINDIELLGDPDSPTPEELIMRAHLDGTSRQELLQALRGLSHRHRPSAWTQITTALAYGFLTEDEVDTLRWLAGGGRVIGDRWEPLRSPRGLDFLLAALPPMETHSDLVEALNTSRPELDGFTALEWLKEEGSPVVALLAILTPAQLVDRARALLGATLVAYIASASSPRIVDEWAIGAGAPSDASCVRLGAACCAAGLLSDHNSAEMAQVWFQALNTQLGGAAPATNLREEPASLTVLAVLVAARRAAGLPL